MKDATEIEAELALSRPGGALVATPVALAWTELDRSETGYSTACAMAEVYEKTLETPEPVMVPEQAAAALLLTGYEQA